MSEEDEEQLRNLDLLDVVHAQAAMFEALALKLEVNGVISVAEVRDGMSAMAERMSPSPARSLVANLVDCMSPDQDRPRAKLRLVVSDTRPKLDSDR